MSAIHTYANPPTRPRPAPATPPPTPEPTPPNSSAAGSHDPLWTATIARARITATVTGLLAIGVLLVVVPWSVMLPILSVLAAAVLVGGLYVAAERATRPRGITVRRRAHAARGEA